MSPPSCNRSEGTFETLLIKDELNQATSESSAQLRLVLRCRLSLNDFQ